MTEKHAVIAGRHVAAATPRWQIGAQQFTGTQIKGAAVRKECFTHHKRMLQVTAVMILTRLMTLAPQFRYVSPLSIDP